MTDYQMVVSIRNGNEQMIQQLYQRYLPYMHKKAWELKQYRFTNEDYEDFIQDCYMAVIKSLDYVDLDQIYDTANWKFLGVLKYFIQNVQTSYLQRDRFSLFEVKENKKRPTQYKMLDDRWLQVAGNYVGIDNFIDNQSSASKDYYSYYGGHELKIDLDLFYKKLDRKKREVFSMRRSGYTLKEVGSELGYTLQWISQIEKELGKDLMAYLEA